jgi:hypothetical protein
MTLKEALKELARKWPDKENTLVHERYSDKFISIKQAIRSIDPKKDIPQDYDYDISFTSIFNYDLDNQIIFSAVEVKEEPDLPEGFTTDCMITLIRALLNDDLMRDSTHRAIHDRDAYLKQSPIKRKST